MAAIAYPELEAPARHRRASPSHLRLVATVPTRRVAAVHRRRRLAAVLAVVVVAGVSWGLVALATSLPPAVPSAPLAAEVVVAQPGDTFWSIAVATGGDGDVRARVDALVAANGGAPLRAGDRVVLPD
jgi:nucleoid-associated protein YgaU